MTRGYTVQDTIHDPCVVARSFHTRAGKTLECKSFPLSVNFYFLLIGHPLRKGVLYLTSRSLSPLHYNEISPTSPFQRDVSCTR